MTKEAIIQKTIKALQLLPEKKAAEISDFADYMLKKHEEHLLQAGIEQLIEQSETFSFLEEEEELYNINDIKEKY